MVLNDYGKKSDLPIYNKLNPKNKSANSLLKKILIVIISIICIGLLVRSFNTETDLTLEQPQEVTDFELYKVTKDGVIQESTDSIQESIISEKIKDPEQYYKDLVDYYDLSDFQGSADGSNNNGEIILFLMPLRNAESVMSMAFHNIMNITYDHSLIDIAFLVSDCSPGDRTLEMTFEYSVALQNGTLASKLKEEVEERERQQVKGSTDLYQLYMDQAYMENVRKSYNNPEGNHAGYSVPFRSISIFKKDFGQIIGQGFSDRHAVKIQGIRRKLMGRARNWLTTSALKPYHSWVYWRDVDIETCPGSVIQDLMKHDYDVMVPNVWRPLPTFLGNEQPYDLNSWIESDPALDLAKTLEEDDVIVEGYAEYPTWRFHLAYARDPNGNPDEVIDLDGVGGVSILAKARVFRHGVNFPAFTFVNHAETEAFGKMAKMLGFKVGGLPHYTVWHIYEPSEDDLKEIARLERKKRRKKNN